MPKANKVRNVSAHGVRLAENRCSPDESPICECFLYLKGKAGAFQTEIKSLESLFNIQPKGMLRREYLYIF